MKYALSYKRFARICVVAAMVSVPVYGADYTLSVEECRSRAVENNLERRMADEQYQKASFTLRQYKTNFYPQFSLSGSMLFSNAKISKDIEGGYLPTYTSDASGNLTPNVIGADAQGAPIFGTYAYLPDIPLSLSLNKVFLGSLLLQQPLYMGGKIQTAYKMASLGTDVARLYVDMSRASVILACDEAYWNCVKARQMVMSLEQYQVMLDELYRVVTEAVRVGMAQKKDELSVQVKRNEAALNLQRAEHAVRLADMNLCHLVGLPLTDHIEVAEDFTQAMETVDPMQGTVANRPEYMVLSKQMELKEQEVELEKSEARPSVGLAAMYGYVSGMELNGEELGGKAHAGALLKVDVPLLHWGEARQKIQSARAESRIAAMQREHMARQMELEMTQAFQAYEESEYEVVLTQKALEQAEENRDISKNRYETGMEMLSDYLEAQTAWQKAHADYISAQASRAVARTAYLKASGQL